MQILCFCHISLCSPCFIEHEWSSAQRSSLSLRLWRFSRAYMRHGQIILRPWQAALPFFFFFELLKCLLDLHCGHITNLNHCLCSRAVCVCSLLYFLQIKLFFWSFGDAEYISSVNIWWDICEITCSNAFIGPVPLSSQTHTNCSYFGL